MNEQTLLTQIAAELQSGKDTVEWTWQRRITEAEKQKRLKFLKYGFYLSNLTVLFGGWLMVATEFEKPEDMVYRYVLYAIIGVYILLNYFVLIPMMLKHASAKQYNAIMVKIRFGKQRVQVNEQTYRFHKHGAALGVFGTLDDKQPETLAQLQRVQTLLYEKTGLHFE